MKNELVTLHEIAMEFMDEAQSAQQTGDFKTARLFFQKALTLEKVVALGTPKSPTYQLTRSIFFRSAATLAIDCGCYDEAIQLVDVALSVDPHPAFIDELQALAVQAQAKIEETEEVIEITGRLVGADLPNHLIKLQTSPPEKVITMEVSKDQLPQLVQQYWEKIITVAGIVKASGTTQFQVIR